ncbi:MAG: ATP-dependent helicase [Polyangiaceae bacterium]|nr:ATP-dependent helicase [Polyangiaceae bacterium]
MNEALDLQERPRELPSGVHGTIQFNGLTRTWDITATPHVSMKLKRVFGQIGSNQVGRYSLKNTPEVCRDLLWFCDRYPLEIVGPAPAGYMADAYIQRQADFHRARTETVQKLLEGLVPPRAFELTYPPREYQRVAAEMWLLAGGLLVADDLGLGKTITAIAGLTDPITRPSIVVTMTHLVRQWQSEFAKFAPALRVVVPRRGTPTDGVNDLIKRPRERIDRSRQASLPHVETFPDVVVLNYQKFVGWAELLKDYAKSLIFDECQELRTGEGTGKYSAAKLVRERVSYCLGLSASPIYNMGDEFHAVLSIIQPDAIGTRTEFITQWGGGSSNKIADPKAFGAWLRAEGLMIRRTKADVGRELPDLTIIPHMIEADLSAIEKVASDAAELARVILQGGGKGFDKLKASEELSWKLRHATGLAKAPYVADFVRVIVESGEQVVLFGWHHDVYEIWKERLKDLGVALYTGKESDSQKSAARESFINGKAKVLIMSLRAGAGLDGLQHVCSTTVHGELDWSGKVHEQGNGRVHRDGQKEKVLAYYMLIDSGSDPVISDVIGVKQQQSEGVLNPDAENAPLVGNDKDVKKLAEDFLRRRGLAVPEQQLREAG